MLESNSFVRCLTIDFSKAFDVVNHEFQTTSSLSFEFEFELAQTFMDLFKSISVE